MSRAASLLLLGLIAGCSHPSATPKSQAEDQARETFASFQAALKARDADQLWTLLDAESQADAERAAKAVKEAYVRANPDEKSEQEKALGLPATELSALTGRGFLKTNRFHGKYDEIPESKIDKVTIQGETATLAYIEPDGDKEKLTLVRQEGQWKITLPMPR